MITAEFNDTKHINSWYIEHNIIYNYCFAYMRKFKKYKTIAKRNIYLCMYKR